MYFRPETRTVLLFKAVFSWYSIKHIMVVTLYIFYNNEPLLNNHKETAGPFYL